MNDVCGGGDVCCHALNAPQNSACGAPGSCNGPPIEISCERPSDCPNEICCGFFDFVGGQQGYRAVRCDATCDPPEFDLTGIILCADDPSVCPGGPQNCMNSSSLPPGFMFCQPN